MIRVYDNAGQCDRNAWKGTLKADYSCSTVKNGSEKIRSLTLNPTGGDVSRTQEPHLHLEVGHILFLDIVGYSKLLSDEQKELVQELNQIVRETEQFRTAEAEGKLTRLPTGDGMVLVFTNNPEAPVECALEISKALRSHPNLKVRMGIHSGPVNPVADVNDQSNLLGAAINVAQRVMCCGDAGHILLSKHFAEDLEHYAHWRSHLHDIGKATDKRGLKVPLVNLYTDQLGNSALPAKLRRTRATYRAKSAVIASLLLMTALAVAFWILRRSQENLTTAPAVLEKSIAVLPFENRSEEKANEFFADGVQDEILTDLARIADLKVISRTSVMHYKSGVARNLREIGQQLGVANVVEGSVQRSGNRVRVNAQLVDARTDRHVWAQTYDRDLADVFAIQSEIAKTIADQLQAKLSPSEKKAIDLRPTGDLVAFDLYARAKALILTASASGAAKANLLHAIELLNEAVAHDPSFFDAYCQLADAHGQLYLFGFDHTQARLALAEAAVAAAARLRPDAGEMHLARARNLYQGYGDYDRALAELDLALQTLPNDARIYQLKGFIQRRQKGRYEEATRTLEHAIDLDPRNFLTLNQIAAYNYPRLGRYADAKSAWDRLLAIRPDDANLQVESAALEFDWKADTRPLHQAVDSIRATNPAALQSIADVWLRCALAERDAGSARNALVAAGDGPMSLSNGNVSFNRLFVEGLIARMTHDDAAAQSAFTAARVEQNKIVQAEPNYGPAVCVLGLIDAGLGRKEEAIQEGRHAVELLPVEKDLSEGMDLIKYLAMIAAWVGDKDLACEQLAIAISGPSSLTYGELKLLPFWDPLRGDPRFEKLVDEAKKPVALK
jgi:TolB-like protein/class 3 adenylate cyclase/Tfp pilus assembly protein PilF